MAKQFEVGQVYSTRSIADYDTIMQFEIVARTAKTVTIRDGRLPIDGSLVPFSKRPRS